MRDVILYQSGPFSVRQMPGGFEVYQDRSVAAVRVAAIGYPGPAGLVRAIAEADRRYAAYLPADQRAELRGRAVDVTV